MKMRVETGDRVAIATGGEKMAALVIAASDNGRSLMLEFDGILDGHVGSMAVLLHDDGVYRSVTTGRDILLADFG